MSRSIRVSIDRIVLHGVQAVDRRALATSVQRELAALVAARDRGTADRPSSARPAAAVTDRLGAQIAREAFTRMQQP